MGVDIDKWVLQCADCQFSRPSIKQEPKYIPICLCGEASGIAGYGPCGQSHRDKKKEMSTSVSWLTTTPNGLRPMPFQTVVSRCIINFFYRFGAPKRILTDQGTEFVNQMNRELCGFLSVERRLCAPYHPQTNGLVEK
ncbi:hypothetical protein QQF64_018313 [Cirrhinus molitorella]|uniref:Integrase catalytic domain-containing protein n=1 Tax=Cirrhinus molitorella TaxID=172907 RepID=A0ABR3LC83_9TELE